MRKMFFTVLAGTLFMAACKKSNSNNGGAGATTFTATINGKATTFNVTQATLLRSTAANEKRLDIAGTSIDNSQMFIITLGIETANGNGMTVKPYLLNAFPDDDPNTPDDESLYTQGYTTFSTKLSGGGWYTDVYLENGLFNVTACDSTNLKISGTFQTTLRDYNEDTVVYAIKDGKVANLKYTVVN